MKMMSLLKEDVSKYTNAGISKFAVAIASLTATRPDAVQKFADTNNLNIEKLYQFLKKSKLDGKMNFVSALVGKDGNPIQKKMIKMFGESINEGKFKVDDLVYNKRTKTVGIVRMGDDKHGEVKTDADGNVSVDELEKYNPIKFKHQTKAKVAPSTEKEVNSRGLFNPFKAESVNELKKLPSGNFSIKKAYNTFADYEKNAKVGDTILKYDKRGQMIKTFVNGSELDKNAEKYLDKVNNITSGVVYLSKKGMKGVAQVPDYEKKEVGVLVLESKINEAQDHEVSMSQNSLDSIIKYATELKQKMGEMEKDIPAWIQDHITNAENYISQASSNYHDYDGISESINEVDGMLNKKVYKLLMKELGDLRTGGPNHQFAVMHVLIGALRDANFHSDAKKVPALFPKAEYEGDPMGKEDTIDIYEYDLGPKIANMAQWDGGAIVDAIAFYTSMTIGRPLGQKIEKLVESKS